MKKLLAILFTLTAAMPLVAQTKSRYLISMRRTPAISALRLVRDVAESTTHNVRTFKTADFIGADLTEAEAAELRSNPDVAYVSPVVLRSLNDIQSGTPVRLSPATEGRYSKTQTIAYGIDLVHAREVWPYTRGKGIVNVAVVDTGIDYNHPDLKDRYMGGYNAWTKTNDPKDDHGHGTHVSGIIAASDNAFGVVGVAPEVRLWAAKVLQSNGTGTDETVMAGIDWVINKKREIGGNWVINLSLGATAASDPERAIFQRAIDENILVVAAAGNRGSRGLDWPAAYDRVVAVSAIDSKSALADFSSFGNGVVFASPGVDVVSTYRVGYTALASIESSTNELNSALPLDGSALGEITAQTAFCEYGRPEEIPADIKGKIALIHRGPSNFLFRDKAKNAINAGAVGVVIIPFTDDIQRPGWTLFPLLCTPTLCGPDPNDTNFKWTLVLSTSAKDGAALIENAGKGPITLSYESEDYAFLSGTSMATPHVAGVAALVWSLAPDASAEQIRLAMKLSAFDLGLKGYDEQFGYGRIDALAAAKYVAPSRFGLPPTQDPDPTRRRPSSPHH